MKKAPDLTLNGPSSYKIIKKGDPKQKPLKMGSMVLEFRRKDNFFNTMYKRAEKYFLFEIEEVSQVSNLNKLLRWGKKR